MSFYALQKLSGTVDLVLPSVLMILCIVAIAVTNSSTLFKFLGFTLF